MRSYLRDILWAVAVFLLLLFILFYQPRAASAALRVEEKAGTGSSVAFKITGTWYIDVATAYPVTGTRWVVESSGPIQGGAFVQTKAVDYSIAHGCIARMDTTGICKRLRLEIDKPTDKSGYLAIQSPSRSPDKVTMPTGTSTIVYTVNELSLGDYGQFALNESVEGATSSSFGVILLNTHADDLTPMALVAATLDGAQLANGAKLPHGWWFLFFGNAKNLETSVDPNELLSLCGLYPNGKTECSSGNSLNVRVTKSGYYLFVAWSKTMDLSVFSIQGT